MAELDWVKDKKVPKEVIIRREVLTYKLKEKTLTKDEAKELWEILDYYKEIMWEEHLIGDVHALLAATFLQALLMQEPWNLKYGEVKKGAPFP